MSSEDEAFDDPSDRPERCGELEGVRDVGSFGHWFEEVLVRDALEGAGDHDVDEAVWSVEFGDLDAEAPEDSEVAPFERDRVAEIHDPLSQAVDDALVCVTQALRVFSDVEREVETGFLWGVDGRVGDDRDHFCHRSVETKRRRVPMRS